MTKQQEFIRQIAPAAVDVQTKTGLPAAALVAQVCLETLYGQKVCKDMDTGKYSFNLFNIKGTGPAGSVRVYTKEHVNGQWVTIKANFRAYHNYKESFQDYIKLILGTTRYRLARAQKDPVKYAKELQVAGYATDPQYSSKISTIMRMFNIDQLVKGLLSVTNQVKTTRPQPAAWAAEAIKKVQANKIMVGDPDGYFRPKEPVTREELAVILCKLGVAK